MIKIHTVELREIHLPLVHYFETSFGRTTVRKIILVTARDGDALGYGECTAGEEPDYSSETTETAWHVLSDFLVPRLLGRELENACATAQALRTVRGHRMAKAAIETALWDLESRTLGISLARHIGGTRREIPCGVSIGIQSSIEILLEKVRREIAAGYRRIKIKIKPGWDIEPLSRIRAEFPDLPLMADANSAYSLDDLPLLCRLDPLNLMMVEQPLAHDDIVDHAKLQAQIKTPICLDESIRSKEDARKAIEMGSCRIINVKLGRVGGYCEALAIHDTCLARGVPIWCGGMLESGVGRAHNIAMSSLAGFILPGDVSASRRYYEEDTVLPPVTVTPEGTIRLIDRPGIGYDLDWERIRRATVRIRHFGPAED
jgi:O-succinylbenzoate synthase